MKKVKTVLFLLLSVFILISCGGNSYKNEDSRGIIKAKSYDEVSEIDFSNKDKELTQKVVENAAQNPYKMDAYAEMITMYATNPDGFYIFYTKAFLDKNNKFSKPTEKNLKEFLKIYANKDYDGNFYEVIIPKIEEMIRKDYKNNYRDLDNVAKNFIDSLNKKMFFMKEIIKYYEEKEYQEDDYKKGKNLSEEYLKSYREAEIKYNSFYGKFKEDTYILMKNDLEETKGNAVLENLIKVVILTDMLDDEFIEGYSKLGTLYPAPEFKIKKEDKSAYVNNLKSIQKTLKTIILNIDKFDKNQIMANNIDLDKYNELISKIKETSGLSEKIINKIENQENEIINAMIAGYFENRQEMFNLYKDLR